MYLAQRLREALREAFLTLHHRFKFLWSIVLAALFFVAGAGVCLANHTVRVSDLDAAAFVVRYNDTALREDSVVRLAAPLLSNNVKLKNYRVYEADILGTEEKARLFLNVNEAGALSSIVMKSEKVSVSRSLALRRVLALTLESLGLTDAERADFFSSEEKSPDGDGALRHVWCKAAGRKIIAFYDVVHAPDILVLYAWDE